MYTVQYKCWRMRLKFFAHAVTQCHTLQFFIGHPSLKILPMPLNFDAWSHNVGYSLMDGGLHTGAVAGSVTSVLIVLVMIMVLFVVIMVWWRKKR